MTDGDTLIPPFDAMDGLGENVAKQIVVAAWKKENSTSSSGKRGKFRPLVEKMDEIGTAQPEDNQLSLFDDLF